MPTLAFFLYLLILGGLWIFRVTYIGWLGSYLFVSAVVLPPALVLLSLPSVFKLRIQVDSLPTFTRGKEAHLCLRFLDTSIIPLRQVSVYLEVENRFTGEKTKERYRFYDLVDGRGELPLPTKFCGQLVCRLTRVECRDLLGLFAVRRKCPPPLICTILPEAVAPQPVPDLDAALNTAATLKPKYGGGYSEEHDLREYRPGDTVNSIHWKLSSKVDDVIVREPLINANREIYLILAQTGKDDHGLERLYWLSLELCQREIPHILVADTLYEVGNEAETGDALCTILAKPMDRPCAFDASGARCVFLITDEEVTVR